MLDDEKNDRGLSVLISHYFKEYCDSDPHVFIPFARDHLLPMTLNALKDDSQFILDFTERI